MKTLKIVVVLLGMSGALLAQNSPLSPQVKAFVSIDAPVVALTHVRVIDGTGAAPRQDQTVIIANGKIQSIADARTAAIPQDARVLELTDHTVFPGLVGMHDHLFYPSGGGVAYFSEQPLSFPRLYLACGVTTIRTTGGMDPIADLNLKRMVDAGLMPGPKIFATGAYLEGPGSLMLQLHQLKDADEARKFVDYWADMGATSMKAYTHITRAELAAAIEESHKRGLKLTGHLCSVGFRESAAFGIDNLEHGLLVDSEFVPGKKPDLCPSGQEVYASILKTDVNGAPVQEMIQDLVKHNVAITSTMAVFEAFLPNRPVEPRFIDALLPESLANFMRRARVTDANSPWPTLLKKEMDFEYAFAKAGGLLMVGPDPTGNGGVVAGFGDQRGVELLVDAGFTPLEAIKIATYNGAKFMGELEHIGTLETGKQADIVVVMGDPSAKISDIEKVKIVFKDGVGYDPFKLIDSVKGIVGLR